MNYLLDTHYILWILFSPEIIKEKIINILEDEKSIKQISGINLWEISLKYSLGKLELEDTNPDEIFEAINNSGFELLEVNNQLFIELALEITYGLKIKRFVKNFRADLKEHLENNTGINVKEINIKIYSLKVQN